MAQLKVYEARFRRFKAILTLVLAIAPSQSEISEIAIASTELPSLFCIDHTASRPLPATEFLFWSKIDPVLSQVVNHNPFKSPVPLPCPHIPGALVDFFI